MWRICLAVYAFSSVASDMCARMLHVAEQISGNAVFVSMLAVMLLLPKPTEHTPVHNSTLLHGMVHILLYPRQTVLPRLLDKSAGLALHALQDRIVKHCMLL